MYLSLYLFKMGIDIKSNKRYEYYNFFFNEEKKKKYFEIINQFHFNHLFYIILRYL